LVAYIVGGKRGTKKYRSLIAEYWTELQQEQRQAEQQEWEAQVRLAQWAKLLQDVIWPRHINLVQESSFASFVRQRDVSEDSRGDTGLFHSHKLQRQVVYESALEQRFLAQLESFDDVLFYQEQPLQIPYQVNNISHIYYPDFFFVLRDGRGVVVEIKGRNEMALHRNWTKWAAMRDFCRQQGYGCLVTSGRYSIQEVGRKEVREAVRTTLLTELKRGPITWPEYKALREKCGITTTELYALIIRERLVWQLRPFLLTAPNLR
jgi:hypothetical protein